MSVDISKLPNIKRVADGVKPQAQLKQANQDFEALLMRHLVKAMRKTVPDSGLFSSETARQFNDHLIESALSDSLASGGGIGINKLMESQQEGETKRNIKKLVKILSPGHDIADRGRVNP
jgi:flagellar protein FlgJ